MLLLSRRSIRLRVYYDPPQIRIVPVVDETEEEHLVSTFAKNEQLLASIFLSIAEPKDLNAQLVTYFEQRGWRVE